MKLAVLALLLIVVACTPDPIQYPEGTDLDVARADCESHGGTLNECASPCEEGDFCIQVCVPMCEFGG